MGSLGLDREYMALEASLSLIPLGTHPPCPECLVEDPVGDGTVPEGKVALSDVTRISCP
jgi:hypothetical protein